MPRFLLYALLMALPLGWGLDRLLDPGPLRLSLRGEAAQLTLECPSVSLVMPRPPSASSFDLGFYDSPTDPAPSRQRLLSASLDGAGLNAAAFPLRLPARFHLELAFERPSDLNLIFRSERGEGAAFLVRPRHNDLAWAAFGPGGYSRMEDLRPLEPLSAAREAARLAALLLRLTGLAGVFSVLIGALARALRALPRSPESSWKTPRWAAPAAALILGACVAAWGFEKLPHVSDEIAAMFQARLFAAGQAAATPAPEAGAFRCDQMLMDQGGWRAKYAPLWPAALALGQALGAAWLVMPLALALTVWLLAGWAREADPDSAPWAAWALALSPWALVMGASHFNHALAAAAGLVFLAGLWRSAENRGPAWIPAAGLAGLAAMRPFSAALFLAAGAAWLALDRDRARHARLLTLCAAAAALAVLGSNAFMTGNPLLSPYTLYDPADRPGFGPGLGSLWTWGSPGHDLAKALANTRVYLDDLATRLQGWPLALSLAPALLALLRRRSRLDSLLWLATLSLVAGHFFYWSGNLLTHGAFYWFQAAPLLAWLGVRGLLAEGEAWGARGRASSLALAMIFSAWGLAFFLPPQVQGLRGFAQVDGKLKGLLDQVRPLAPALLLVEDRNALSFHEAAAMQEGSLKGPWVFARARGGEPDRRLAAAFPGRRVLYWDGILLRGWKSGKVVTSIESAKLGATEKARPASQLEGARP